MNKEIEEMTGTCKFCGQTMIVECSDPLIANKIATEECKCEEGREFRNMEEWKFEAKNNIESLCESMGETTITVLYGVVDAIAAGEIKKASIKVNERVNISVVLKKDCIDVERSYKEKNVLTAEKM